MFSLHIDTGAAWTGGQRQTQYTVLGLRAIGHRAALAAHPKGELLRRMSEGLDLIPLAPAREIDLAAAWDLSRVIRQLRPDVIHAHDPLGLAMAAMALSISSPTPRPPLVASRRAETRAGHNSFARWTESEVACFIASCRSIRDRLVADGIRSERAVVVHEGVDVDRIAHLPRANVHAEFFLPVGAPVIGTVAVLAPHKGLHHLIDAAAEVIRAVPDARVIIAGDGELRPALEEHIHHRHLERHVLLAGFRADALELTKGFDVFAVSSVAEAMCTPLLDAMAAGVPAVASAVGGVPDAIDHEVTGLLVKPRDHHELAAGLARLLKDGHLRQRMGTSALRRAREEFSVARLAERVVDVYRTVSAGADEP